MPDAREAAAESLKNLAVTLLEEATAQVKAGTLPHVHDTLNSVQTYVRILQELKTRK